MIFCRTHTQVRHHSNARTQLCRSDKSQSGSTILRGALKKKLKILFLISRKMFMVFFIVFCKKDFRTFIVFFIPFFSFVLELLTIFERKKCQKMSFLDQTILYRGKNPKKRTFGRRTTNCASTVCELIEVSLKVATNCILQWFQVSLLRTQSNELRVHALATRRTPKQRLGKAFTIFSLLFRMSTTPTAHGVHV